MNITIYIRKENERLHEDKNAGPLINELLTKFYANKQVELPKPKPKTSMSHNVQQVSRVSETTKTCKNGHFMIMGKCMSKGCKYSRYA